MITPQEYIEKLREFARDLIESLDVQGDVEAAALALASRLADTIDDFVRGK